MEDKGTITRMETQTEFLVDEETLEVPSSLVKSKTGFSFDIGLLNYISITLMIIDF